ncbi:hypothetical protein F5Y04DRAFT_96510 [Hypomontagnella monticulosa]|nr:hypothetical protein F5Y04DRAFT_96510 [Hypomontagnella monticulosa]
MDPSYSDYVKHLSREWPGLEPLAEFLTCPHQQPEVKEAGCRIECLQFQEDGNTYYTGLDADGVVDAILDFTLNSEAAKTAGICILVEDIEPRVINALGGALDINPHFFGGHIERSFVEIEKGPPSSHMVSLPSHVGSQNYVNLHYQRPIDLGEKDTQLNIPYHLRLRGNSVRPGRSLPALFGRNVGFIRSCFSIFHKQIGDSQWVSIMLMDSICADVLSAPLAKNNPQTDFQTRQVPYRSKRDNQGKILTFSEFRAKDPPAGSARPISLLDEVARSLQGYARASTVAPPAYDIFSLSAVPIKLIIDEWLTYSLIMGRYVKAYEYSIKKAQNRSGNFESEDIIDLYRWRRRSQQSLHKIHVLKWFVESSSSSTKNYRENTLEYQGGALERDIAYLINLIEQNRNALEAMIPIITSIIQLLDSRRSTVEAIYVKRLTYIALIFLPLSFVATLFSMSDFFSIDGDHFWIYIATAVPLLLLVLVISSSPITTALAKLNSLFTSKEKLM